MNPLKRYNYKLVYRGHPVLLAIEAQSGREADSAVHGLINNAVGVEIYDKTGKVVK